MNDKRIKYCNHLSFWLGNGLLGSGIKLGIVDQTYRRIKRN